MNKIFLILVFTLLLAFIIFLIWNIILFKKNIKLNKETTEYLELKYQLQFYVAVFSVLIGVFTFLGYSSYNEIVEKVTHEISEKTKDTLEASKKEITRKIESTQNELFKIAFENERIKESNKSILENNEKTNDRFYQLYNQFLSLNKELYNSEKQLQSQIDNVNNAEKDVVNIKKDVEEIKKIDFLNQVYLVTDIYYQESQKGLDTVYFKNLKTISGNKLPDFSNPPSITISPYQGVQLAIQDVTKDYFTIYMWTKGSWGEEKTSHKYDILLVYKESVK
ncbi:hypothetical protein C8C83_2796 [Flavobacterium sp. 90]|uniref:hypothetical protein n=1 Tax=unclassified Flavobacterium TaxID=196869 RepID=UPI000EB01CA7|nr:MULTISPECIES: hypothetical protein [unclassified Flavobacterium]RKR11098.1 hypothetical protein C8C82_3104 [Flavobacterium sp. 81]TCK54881.1 hypothetical protein C8C83_2796 [Flavobacterium sp. 90]